MTASLRPIRSIFTAIRNNSGRFKGATAALLFVLPVLGTLASAQTTTISGTVYDPRTTASALPLPNVLVYVTTGTVAPLPSGVQCLTASTPSGVASYTNTAVDGTFTLAGVPVNTAYTLVIQAGKWRRQFSETVATAPLTGLALHMPADHTQGDIPLIAIATGSTHWSAYFARWASPIRSLPTTTARQEGASICTRAAHRLERISMRRLLRRPCSWELPRIHRS